MTMDAVDPKNLVASALTLEGLAPEEWRAIFLDWAFSLRETEPRAAAALLVERHADRADHPFVALLREAVESPPPAARRGARSERRVRF